MKTIVIVFKLLCPCINYPLTCCRTLSSYKKPKIAPYFWNLSCSWLSFLSSSGQANSDYIGWGPPSPTCKFCSIRISTSLPMCFVDSDQSHMLTSQHQNLTYFPMFLQTLPVNTRLMLLLKENLWSPDGPAYTWEHDIIHDIRVTWRMIMILIVMIKRKFKK